MGARGGPDDTAGLDLGRLAAFMDSVGIERTGALHARRLTGGRSNLTYEVGDGTCRWVVRRPPLGHVLDTAHDMAREYRVLGALGTTAVPVPRVHVLCTDPDVVGAPFYVMERVEGTAYRTANELAGIGAARTRTISEAMIDTLAVLHDVDPQAVGLADFGRPAGFLRRQIRRWKAQLDASRNRVLEGADDLFALLSEREPPESDPAVVHGDFRLDNLLVDDDRVAAVIDWEMATLGDPLTDVALLLVYRQLADLVPEQTLTDAFSAPGFLSESELLDRYAERTGRALSQLGFYRGLACFKLAAILEGIHYRDLQGYSAGAGFGAVATLVEPAIAAGIASLDGGR